MCSSDLLPPGATDTHAHICGPKSRYAYFDGRVYTPPDCLLPDYRHMLATLGVQRAVLVQPSVYGTDNAAMLDALREAGPSFRAVAVVENDDFLRRVVQARAPLDEADTTSLQRIFLLDAPDAALPAGVLPARALFRHGRADLDALADRKSTRLNSSHT